MVVEKVSVDNTARVADELEIRNLLALVAHYCDTGRLDAYLDLFTEDAVWEMPDNPQLGVAASRRSGRRAIEDGARERAAAGVQGPGTSTAHVLTTLAVRFEDADTAVSEAYWMYFAQTDAAPVVKTMGHYADRLRRTGQGWKLAHRRVTVGTPTPG